MTDTNAKRDIQKLQRIIVDGLEDVKAQDIVVYNTEHMSPLFERVIIASGTSNRQTKALAASVRDKIREAGYQKPRIEGEENGEWIIVDCGPAVVHVMQPAIRQYYHLEEIWGEKPVRFKHGADKLPTPQPVVAKAVKPASRKTAAGKVASAKSSGKARAAAPQAAAKKAVASQAIAKKAAAPKASAKKAPAKTPARKSAARQA
jgi:ribosome-associated protein